MTSSEIHPIHVRVIDGHDRGSLRRREWFPNAMPSRGATEGCGFPAPTGASAHSCAFVP